MGTNIFGKNFSDTNGDTWTNIMCWDLVANETIIVQFGDHCRLGIIALTFLKFMNFMFMCMSCKVMGKM